MAGRADLAISDILETVERLQAKAAGITFDEFRTSWELRFTFQRGIEIISEASRRIPEELKSSYPNIRWRSIANVGNVLRHEYHTISDKIIWDVVTKELPALKTAAETMLKKIME